MIVFDANVVSELIRSSPEVAVEAWVAPIDCQIAAIAQSNGMAVTTRNVRDFPDMGIHVINPWEGA